MNRQTSSLNRHREADVRHRVCSCSLATQRHTLPNMPPADGGVLPAACLRGCRGQKRPLSDFFGRGLSDQIDTATTSGRFFFHVMASLAQMERDLTAERTRAGLKAARGQGRTGGRKRKMTDSKLATAKRLLQDGVPPRAVAKDLGVSIPTLYRWLPASSLSLDERQAAG